MLKFILSRKYCFIFFAFLLFLSCTPEKRILKRSINKQIFKDTNYALLEIPYLELDNRADFSRFDLRDRGFIKYDGDTSVNVNTYKRFSIEQISKKFLRYNLNDGYSTYGYFMFYQIGKIKFTKYNLNAGADSAIAEIEVHYNVTPLENIRSNPKLISFTMVKEHGYWLINDPYKVNEDVYSNLPTGNGGSFRRIFPKTILQSLDSLYMLRKSIK